MADVVGGFHLVAAPRERVEETARCLSAMGVGALHPCHCTDLAAKVALARLLSVHEVGVGLRIEYS